MENEIFLVGTDAKLEFGLSNKQWDTNMHDHGTAAAAAQKCTWYNFVDTSAKIVFKDVALNLNLNPSNRARICASHIRGMLKERYRKKF